MYQKLQRKVCSTPKQEHLTMQVQRFGATSLMIINLIFGHLDVYSMNQSLSNPHLELKTCKAYIKKC